MIDFVVCDDDIRIREKVADLIDQVMFDGGEYYKHLFDDYDDKFLDFIKKSNGLTIYILDIETKTSSGIDIAFKIREKDYNSVIIFLTAYPEKGIEVLKNEFLSLTFIIKNEDYLVRLKSAILKGLKMFDCKKLISFEAGKVSFRFLVDDINYIYRDTFSRKCVIVTDNTKLLVRKPLCFFEQNLDFVKTHRACIVNKNKLVCFDRKKRKIIFLNGEELDLVSSLCGDFSD